MLSLAAARQLLLQLLQAGIAAVDGRQCARKALQRLFPTSQSLPPFVSIFAIGKAAAAMTLGASDALGERLQQSLVITRAGHAAGLSRSLASARLLESAHPVPDASSLDAGAALLAAVQSLSAEQFPLFLISGGSSSLVEVLRDGVSLADLRRCNEEGLAQGLDIEALNRQRRELSLIKGGGLTRALRGRPALALFISDVPGDSPAVIGSGLLEASADTIRRHVIANVDLAQCAVVDAANTMGLLAVAGPRRFAGDAHASASECVQEMAHSTAPLRVWGGESTVLLPSRPGRGGRNQHLALAAAIAMSGREDLLLLAAGTDGNDGNTEDAGALVDGQSCDRMCEQGIDARDALRRADSGNALAASCDLIHTGPTGTNVGDLIIGMRFSATAGRHAGRYQEMV